MISFRKCGCSSISPNGLQLNADFVLHKICVLGAVIKVRWVFERKPVVCCLK